MDIKQLNFLEDPSVLHTEEYKKVNPLCKCALGLPCKAVQLHALWGYSFTHKCPTATRGCLTNTRNRCS